MNKIYFGENIRFLRNKNRITQEKLGERLSCTGSNIAKWEKGVSTPPIEVASKIAYIFNIPLVDLLYSDLSTGTSATRTDEEELLTLYNSLNEEGKDELLSYASYLTGKAIYKKFNMAI